MEYSVKKNQIVKAIIGKVLFGIVLGLILLFFLAPLLWLVSTSFKNFRDAFALPPKIFFIPTLENYQAVFNNGDFGLYIFNSIIIAFGSTLICMILGVPGAYALACFEFPRKNDASFFILSTRIAPPIMSIMPLYIIFNHLHLVGSRVPLMIMYILMNLPLVIWIMPVYFRDIPVELKEAAKIDGCSEFQAFMKVMIPVARGGIAATGILCIIQAWNEFLFALILSGRNSQTLPVAVTSFMTFQGTEWGPLSAAGTIIMIPMIIFGIMIQKNFVKGMTMGAVKG
jgi:multiple sugar transport system permease protein